MAGAAWAFVLAAAYGVIDELHQAFVPGRTSSVDDALLDAFGAALPVLVIVVARMRGRSRERRHAVAERQPV